MRLEDFPFDVTSFPCAMPVWHARTDRRALAARVRAGARERRAPGRVVGGGPARQRRGLRRIRRADGALGPVVVTALAEDEHYPDISDLFPAAGRMQRAAYDLLGVRADGAQDKRKWLRHAAWPEDVFPLRKDFPYEGLPEPRTAQPDNYPFVKSKAKACTRFPSAPCTRARSSRALPFLDRGRRHPEARRAPGLQAQGHREALRVDDAVEGARLAGRISGDSTVAYAWAYAMAVECAAAMTPPAARCACVRCCSNGTYRPASVGPRLPRQRCGACVRLRAVLAAARGVAAREPCDLRPSLSHGHHRAGRRRVRSGRRRPVWLAHEIESVGGAVRASQRLRRACGTAGSLHRLRPRSPSSRRRWGSRALPAAPARSRGTCACSFRPCHTSISTCAWRRIATATWRRASWSASTRSRNHCG